MEPAFFDSGRRLALPLSLALVTTIEIRALPIKLETMPVDFEMVLHGQLLLQSLEFRIEELKNPAAFLADHVIVVLNLGMAFVAGKTVAEPSFLDKTAFNEQVQGSIDRRIPDLGIDGFDLSQQLLDGNMPHHIEEHADDRAALLGRFQTANLNEFLKVSLFFADDIGGNLFFHGHERHLPRRSSEPDTQIQITWITQR